MSAERGMTEWTANGVDYTINDPNIAEEFDPTKAYHVRDHVYYQGNLYVFVAEHAAGAWNTSHVLLFKVGAELANLWSANDTEATLRLAADNDLKSALGEYQEFTVTGYVNKEFTFQTGKTYICIVTYGVVAYLQTRATPTGSAVDVISATTVSAGTMLEFTATGNASYLRIPSDATQAMGGYSTVICAEKSALQMQDILIKKSITELDTKTAAADKELSDTINYYFLRNNLFNPWDAIDNKQLNSNGTGALADNSNFATSGFIPVTPGVAYIGNFTNHALFLKSDKVTPAATQTNQVTQFTAPPEAAYIRFDWDKRVISTENVTFNSGTTLVQKYQMRMNPNSVEPYEPQLFQMFQRTDNLYNNLTRHDDTKIDYSSGSIVEDTNHNYITSDYIPVMAGTTYISNYTRYVAFYNSSKAKISVIERTYPVTAPENAAFAIIECAKSVRNPDLLVFMEGSMLPRVFEPYYIPFFPIPADKIVDAPYSLQPWALKNVLVYGDSITAQINGDTPTRWSVPFYNKLMLNKIHGRGVGGQKYVWNTATFQVDANGNYVSRGTSADNCLGCFCSWQRISSMIPDTIKDTLDAIIIMGGTNDISGVEEITGSSAIVWSDPIWSAENTQDTQWAASDEYNGGDYDISTFCGAIASTIMKFQARCPQAKIIIASPLSRWDMTNKIPFKANDVSMQDMAEIIHKTADYMSVPFIDVTNTCGINGWNYSTYIADSVHPNDDGGLMLSNALIGGMERIYPPYDE